MKDTDLRLECLKLAHTHGRSSSEAIERAREYESFVLGAEVKSEFSKVVDVESSASEKKTVGKVKFSS